MILYNPYPFNKLHFQLTAYFYTTAHCCYATNVELVLWPLTIISKNYSRKHRNQNENNENNNKKREHCQNWYGTYGKHCSVILI